MNDLHTTLPLAGATHKSDLPIVFMLSGQGSQYYSMGKKLYDYHAGFQQKMQRLDELFSPFVGGSILAKMYHGQKQRSAEFNEVLFTHPAIFMIEYCLAETLIEEGIRPDYILGTSLGEISAVAIAEVISLEESVRFVAQQARLFDQHCPQATMIAIMANPDFYQQNKTLQQYSEIAGINSDSHFVISVAAKAVGRVEDLLRGEDILYQALPVRQGFHSSLIDTVADEFQQLTASIQFKQPTYPIVSAVDGDLKALFDRDYLWDVVRQPIEFLKCFQLLESLGSFHYVDVGPMGTLATLSKQTIADHSRSKIHAILTQFAQDTKNLSQVITLLTNE